MVFNLEINTNTLGLENNICVNYVTTLKVEDDNRAIIGILYKILFSIFNSRPDDTN